MDKINAGAVKEDRSPLKEAIDCAHLLALYVVGLAVDSPSRTKTKSLCSDLALRRLRLQAYRFLWYVYRPEGDTSGVARG